MINNIAGLVQIPAVITSANRMMERCPQSFIMGDFVLDVTALRQINEALSNNEHF